MSDILSLDLLAEQFASLQGVGKKSAVRMAYALLRKSPEDVERFAKVMTDAKAKIHLCPVCQSLTDLDVCPICSDGSRDDSVICVVSHPQDVLSIERAHTFRGKYHVLHGNIDALKGVTPDMLKIQELLDRIADGSVHELIMATDPNTEGEVTAAYIANLLKPYDIKVSRLAYGIPVGSDLEYTDEMTLSRSIEGRQSL